MIYIIYVSYMYLIFFFIFLSSVASPNKFHNKAIFINLHNELLLSNYEFLLILEILIP